MNLMTRLEACEYLKISLDTLERMLKRGDIPAYRLGPKQIRIKREDLNAYLEARSIR